MISLFKSPSMFFTQSVISGLLVVILSLLDSKSELTTSSDDEQEISTIKNTANKAV